MNKALGLALAVGGAILLFYGVNESHSIASSVSKAVTGSPTDHSTVLMVTGAILAVLGGVLMSRSRE